MNIQSKQLQINPDWDEDIVLNLFDLFGNQMGWTPPQLPKITKCIKGVRKKISLHDVKKLGLSQFLIDNSVFSI